MLNLTRNSGNGYTIPRREIYRKVEEVKKVEEGENYGIPEQERIAKIVFDAAFEIHILPGTRF
jgi:hypothetical protein